MLANMGSCNMIAGAGWSLQGKILGRSRNAYLFHHITLLPIPQLPFAGNVGMQPSLGCNLSMVVLHGGNADKRRKLQTS